MAEAWGQRRTVALTGQGAGRVPIGRLQSPSTSILSGSDNEFRNRPAAAPSPGGGFGTMAAGKAQAVGWAMSSAETTPVGALTKDGRIDFATSPEQYRHWRLEVEGPVARLVMRVQEDAPLHPGYEMKLNSYDLGVDIELYDAVQRLRFEHPEVGAVVVTSGHERVFCAGANIRMLAQAEHALKVNFCKFTNETRNAIEDASAHSGQRYICAINGPAAGGGYELALACDHIILVDDGSSTVALPELSLAGGAARHRRADPAGGQAAGAPRPRRFPLHRIRGSARPSCPRVAAGGRNRAPLALR